MGPVRSLLELDNKPMFGVREQPAAGEGVLEDPATTAQQGEYNLFRPGYP